MSRSSGDSLCPWQEGEMLVRRRTYRAKHRRSRTRRNKTQRGGYRAKTVQKFVKKCEAAGTEEDICYNAVGDPNYNIVHRRITRKLALLG
jgi:hypothetical protein